jgi:hypothetical protein
MRPASVVLKFAAATRKDMKVEKKPMASWMTLVATMSVLICARIESLDCMGIHLLHRQIDVVPSRCTCQTLPESYPGYQDCG